MNKYAPLVGINLIYACTSIFTKQASESDFLSVKYILLLSGAVVVLGIYALLWQQVIKRIPISDAYMFRGTAIIFTMLIAGLLFGETISITNIIGSFIIISGIALFAKV